MMTPAYLNDHSGCCAEDGLEEEKQRGQETTEESGTTVSIKDENGMLHGNSGSGAGGWTSELFRRQHPQELVNKHT